ncbi:MAG: hypothetical protein U0574_11735 [Phycisphaerales bacterium]
MVQLHASPSLPPIDVPPGLLARVFRIGAVRRFTGSFVQAWVIGQLDWNRAS